MGQLFYVPKPWILSRQDETFHTTLSIITPSLPRTSLLSCSIYLRQCWTQVTQSVHTSQRFQHRLYITNITLWQSLACWGASLSPGCTDSVLTLSIQNKKHRILLHSYGGVYNKNPIKMPAVSRGRSYECMTVLALLIMSERISCVLSIQLNS